jgi:hypothetical protein
MTETIDKCGHGAENCLNHSPFRNNQASDSPIVIQVRERKYASVLRLSVFCKKSQQNTARINAERP